MATGNGAHVLHKMLENRIDGYRVVDYSPWWTLCPPALPLLMSRSGMSLVHTSPDYGLFFKRPGVPLVITVHNHVCDAFMRSYSSLLQKIHYATDLKWFIRRSIFMADEVVAVSRFTGNLLSEDLGLSKKIRTIYNGIDENVFTPAMRNGIPDGIKVLFAGNLTLRKGADLLPDIADRILPGITIRYTTGLRSGMSIVPHKALECIGVVPHRKMPDIYRSMDLLLMPTVREGLPLAVLEAMACGLPVVASDCSSLPELIDHGKGGFLCPVGDVAAFAEKVNLLAESPALRREMGEYNRARVERMFTLDRMASEYEALFESVAARFNR